MAFTFAGPLPHARAGPLCQSGSAQQTLFDGERAVNLLEKQRHRPVREHGAALSARRASETR